MFWLRFHEMLLEHLNWATVNLTTLQLLEQEPSHTIATISRYWATAPMKQQKFNLKEHLQLIPSDPPRVKRPRDSKPATWPDEPIKGNTGGLQLEIWPYKGQQLVIKP